MKKLLLSVLCVGLVFASCKNDDDSEIKDKTSAKEFFQDNIEKAKQVITINSSELPKTYTLAGGVKIFVPDAAFTKNGAIVTGQFTLEVQEMLKPSSILLSGTNTNYGSQYLKTDGFLHLAVFKDGVALDTVLKKNLVITIPTANTYEYTNLWEGKENAGSDNDQFAWQDLRPDAIVANDSVVQNPKGGNGEGNNFVWPQANTYKFSFGKLGWVNCDVLWNYGSTKTTVKVTVTGSFGKFATFQGYYGDTFVFFCGKGYPVVAQLYTVVNDSTVQSYNNSMPVGAEGKIIAFSIRDGVFAYDVQNVTITANMSLTLNLKEVTEQELLAMIASFDN